jgi:hypothetical protein
MLSDVGRKQSAVVNRSLIEQIKPEPWLSGAGYDGARRHKPHL